MKGSTMNWDQIEGGWKQFAGKAQQTWGDITGDDWAKIKGKREEIVGLVQSRYGRAKEEAEQEVETWMRSL
jgi:uncharacterized protein YjbJ (UPF0337 family)